MSSLSVNCRHEYYMELGNSLPPPVSDTRERHERRMSAAIDAFNDLRPGNAYEGRLAVQIVLCGAHAAETLREAGVHRDDFPKKTRCRAQAASLMREARAAKHILAQEQKLRLAVEAVANGAPAQPAAPEAAALVQAAATPPDALAAAEAFAQENIVAAAQIRHDRGITPQIKACFSDVTFPTDPAVIDALTCGTSDLLSMLDEICGETLDKAA
jgi:hypothetical protein